MYADFANLCFLQNAQRDLYPGGSQSPDLPEKISQPLNRRLADSQDNVSNLDAGFFSGASGG